MCKVTKVSTRGWTREQWETDRQARKTIGGSDAGAILGLNPYKSAYSLWAEKSGKLTPEDISSKESVRLGNDLEQYVADRWMEATGKKLRKDNNILFNESYPFAHANIDRAVIGETDAGFEAKTTSSYDILEMCRSGQYPDSWYCQVTHYMMVTGAQRWYLGVLVFGHGFYHFTIERNEEEIAALATAEADFFQKVLDDTPPSVDGSEATMDTLKALYPDSDGETVDLSAYETDLLSMTEIDKQIKELEQTRDSCKARIMEFMGSAEKGKANGYAVSWKSSTRNIFDKAAYEADNGAIPAQYYKQSSARTFRVSRKKGA